MEAVITTPRLVLRRWAAADLDALHALLSDPVTMRFWPAPLTIEQARSWLDRALQSYADVGYGRWALHLRADNTLIGDCGIIPNMVNGALENDLGYIVHHPYWGVGYAPEAAAACLAYARDTLGLKRLVANMAVDNTPSARVAEKIGMRRVLTYANARNRNLPTYLYVWEADA